MSGFFYTLFVSSIVGAMCTMLSDGGFERYTKYIASLVCICIMLSPLREIDLSAFEIESDFAPQTEEYSEGHYALATEITETSAENYINEIVFSEFGIKPKSTDIKIDWDLNEPTIEKITVVFSKTDIERRESAEDYLKNVLGGEVEIIEG